jgi:hypothetical protein
MSSKLHMLTFPLTAIATVLLGTTTPTDAAETARVFGLQAPAWEATMPGSFMPAGTQLSCAAISADGKCWDGRAWHRLFPAGPRHYMADSHMSPLARHLALAVTRHFFWPVWWLQNWKEWGPKRSSESRLFDVLNRKSLRFCPLQRCIS